MLNDNLVGRTHPIPTDSEYMCLARRWLITRRSGDIILLVSWRSFFSWWSLRKWSEPTTAHPRHEINLKHTCDPKRRFFPFVSRRILRSGKPYKGGTKGTRSLLIAFEVSIAWDKKPFVYFLMCWASFALCRMLSSRSLLFFTLGLSMALARPVQLDLATKTDGLEQTLASMTSENVRAPFDNIVMHYNCILHSRLLHFPRWPWPKRNVDSHWPLQYPHKKLLV